MCGHCDKAFTSNEILVVHVNRVHKKLRRYSCPLCKYTSYAKEEMKNHSNAVHLGKKDFWCDHCDRAFGFLNVLNRHIGKYHRPKNVHKHDLNVLTKEAQKDQMFVSVERCEEPYLPETYRSAELNDQKKLCFKSH
jgi:hypothetical protein